MQIKLVVVVVLPSPIVLGHFFLGLTLAIIFLFRFKDVLTAGILKAQEQTRNLRQGKKASTMILKDVRKARRKVLHLSLNL